MCARRALPFRRRQEYALIPSARLQAIVNAMLGPEVGRQRKALEELIQRNARQGGAVEGFSYKGAMYVLGRKAEVLPLSQDLHDAMELYLLEHDKVSTDAAAMVQGFSPAIVRCESEQDIRDVLPEFLVPLDDALKALRRTREPGFNVLEAPFKLAQFQRAEEIAGYYLANKVLY